MNVATEPAVPVAAGDAQYIAMARAEAAFWSKQHLAGMDNPNAIHPTVFVRHTNRRFTGREDVRWFETVHEHGDFRDGIVLGTSALEHEARILELNPHLRLTFYDISREAVRRRLEVLGSRFTGRVSGVVSDLNFCRLGRDVADVIISSSTLHHIMNLEHAAREAAAALRPGGFLFVQDCVAETRFAFAEEKKRLFEAIAARSDRRRGIAARPLIWRNEDRSLFSPFCGVRSGDVLRVLAETFDPVEVRTAGALAGLLLFASPAAATAPLKERLLARFGRGGVRDKDFAELLLVDDIVCDSGVLVPYDAFGVYGRR